MNAQPPPAASRFVPTLTEVVEPLPLVVALNDPGIIAQAQVSALDGQISALIDRNLAVAEELFHNLLSEHFKNLANNLKTEVKALTQHDINQSQPPPIDLNK
jgi:hypothetical protein